MTYNRIDNLRLVLHSISNMMKAAPYHKPLRLIVTQSVDATVPDFTQPVLHLLDAMRTPEHQHAFQTIEHVQIPIETNANDPSFTNNLKLYGNKKNSMNNLIGGLKRAVDLIQTTTTATAVTGANVMVMEDDVVLSCDVLEYFSYASGLINVDRNEKPHQKKRMLHVASTELLTRPSFFIGNRDIAFFVKTPTTTIKIDPASTATMTANSRTVVKTYAWMLSQAYVHEYLFALQKVVASDNGLDDASHDSTLHGCYFCEPYCYDHVAEWTLAKSKSRIMYPNVPRVTQTSGSGMTYASNPVTPIYQLFVPQEQFNTNGLSTMGESVIHAFDLPGSSTWSNHGPTLGYYVGVLVCVGFVVLSCLAKNKINRIQSGKKVRMKRR